MSLVFRLSSENCDELEKYRKCLITANPTCRNVIELLDYNQLIKLAINEGISHETQNYLIDF